MKRVFWVFFILTFMFVSACSQSNIQEVELMDFLPDTIPVMGNSQRAVRFTREFSSEFTADSSKITTSEGLVYSFSNGTVSEKGIASDGGLVIDLDGAISTEFNRYRLYYVSDKALKCVVKYTVNGSSVEDTVFLKRVRKSLPVLFSVFLKTKRQSRLMRSL